MTDSKPPYIACGIHQFKGNIAKYIRQLEDGSVRAFILKRHQEKVAVVIPYTLSDPENERKKEARKQKTLKAAREIIGSDPIYGPDF